METEQAGDSLALPSRRNRLPLLGWSRFRLRFFLRAELDPALARELAGEDPRNLASARQYARSEHGSINRCGLCRSLLFGSMTTETLFVNRNREHRAIGDHQTASGWNAGTASNGCPSRDKPARTAPVNRTGAFHRGSSRAAAVMKSSAAGNRQRQQVSGAISFAIIADDMRLEKHQAKGGCFRSCILEGRWRARQPSRQINSDASIKGAHEIRPQGFQSDIAGWLAERNSQ